MEFIECAPADRLSCLLQALFVVAEAQFADHLQARVHGYIGSGRILSSGGGICPGYFGPS